MRRVELAFGEQVLVKGMTGGAHGGDQVLAEGSAAVNDLVVPVERLVQQALRRAGLAQRHLKHKQEAAALVGQHRKQAGAGRGAARQAVKRELQRLLRSGAAVEPAW